jgi:hypothetical protein
MPVRSWPALFGLGGAGAPAGPAQSLGDVVSHSVDLAYRVVDDYIRQGQKTAERLGSRGYGPTAATGDMQDLAVRMARYTSDFVGLCFEFLEVATGGAGIRGVAAAAGAAAPQAEGAPPRETAVPAAARVRIEVTSARPAEVSVDLAAHAAGRPLVAQALRAVDPDKPKLTDVAVAGGKGDEPVVVRIRVPAGQPAGVYNGLLIDEETNRPAGTLSVRIAE